MQRNNRADSLQRLSYLIPTTHFYVPPPPPHTLEWGGGGLEIMVEINMTSSFLSFLSSPLFPLKVIFATPSTPSRNVWMQLQLPIVTHAMQQSDLEWEDSVVLIHFQHLKGQSFTLFKLLYYHRTTAFPWYCPFKFISSRGGGYPFPHPPCHPQTSLKVAKYEDHIMYPFLITLQYSVWSCWNRVPNKLSQHDKFKSPECVLWAWRKPTQMAPSSELVPTPPPPPTPQTARTWPQSYPPLQYCISLCVAGRHCR